MAPQLEEIDDVDNMDFDLAEFDPNLKTAIAPKLEKTVVRSQDAEDAHIQQQFERLQQQGQQQQQQLNAGNENVYHFQGDELEYLKAFQILYPVYFNSERSQSQGRRVPSTLASKNPLARTIVDACVALHLQVVYEQEKTHPQDFGNPGRVRVLLKQDGKPQNVLVSNKRELMRRVGQYLQKHPTTVEMVKSQGNPADVKDFEYKEVPHVKGFKMNSIVPMNSSVLLGHPMTKSIYENAPLPSLEEQQAAAEKKVPKMKNKYKVVRR